MREQVRSIKRSVGKFEIGQTFSECVPDRSNYSWEYSGLVKHSVAACGFGKILNGGNRDWSNFLWE